LKVVPFQFISGRVVYSPVVVEVAVPKLTAAKEAGLVNVVNADPVLRLERSAPNVLPLHERGIPVTIPLTGCGADEDEDE